MVKDESSILYAIIGYLILVIILVFAYYLMSFIAPYLVLFYDSIFYKGFHFLLKFLNIINLSSTNNSFTV